MDDRQRPDDDATRENAVASLPFADEATMAGPIMYDPAHDAPPDPGTIEFRPGGLGAAIDALDQVFWLSDPHRNVIHYVSPACARVFGVAPADVYLDGAAWLRQIEPADRIRVEAVLAALPQHGYDLEYRIRRGGDLAYIRERAVPVRDADGAVRRIAGVAEDCTRARLLEDQLRQAQKQEVVSQLAGGIAHDFNNLLAIILMQATALGERVGRVDDGRAREGVDDIISAARRASGLIRSLQALSRREPAQPVLLDLGQAIAGKAQLLRKTVGPDVALETRLEPGLPLVLADPRMMEQVLMNLVLNAREAMPGGGSLAISVRAVDVDGARAARHPGAGPGAHVALAVADTGVGIAPEALPRIFEPFFTTKDAGTGTGLGLAIALGLVQQQRGWIEVDTAIGHGTTVTVLLPVAARAEVEERAASPRVPVRGGHETILLVEDEAAVRASTRVVLQRYGYRVIEADSAAVALARWEAEGGGIDLLLTDVVMGGGISGRQLAETLRARGPRLKVLFMSGYTRDFLTRVLQLEPGPQVVSKPCTSAELASAVRRCLDGAGAG